jgi:hypothetical protein
VKVLLVMCRKYESVNIFRISRSIDHNAFITQANVNGVYGNGFDAVKFKIKSTRSGMGKEIITNEETADGTAHEDKLIDTSTDNLKKSEIGSSSYKI